MGIFNFLGKQFIDVIDWVEENNGTLAIRVPMADREIQTGAKLTVRESQLALFVNEGEIADQFKPGLYTLTTQNLPILTNLKNWDKAFASPFKSDIYFFSTRDQLDQKWGTATPLVIRDKEFGPIRLRAHGSYSYRIKNPKAFYLKVSGSRDVFTTEELEGQLRAIILTNLASHFGSSEVDFVEMAGNQKKFSDALKEILAPGFADYGLELQSYFIQSVSLPEEIQQYLDKRASMKIIGDLKDYAQFQSAEAITKAAENQGGAAGAGMGMGVGMMMGQNLMGATGTVAAASGTQSEDPLAMISKLHDLMKAGVLTEAEFNAKKAELLGKIK